MTVYTATPTQVQTPWFPGSTFVISAYFELTGAALASADTIVWPNAITPSGIVAVACQVSTSQLDSNASPTLVYEFGDDVSGDTNGPGRFITAAAGGTNVSGAQINYFSNVPPAFSAGVQTKGIGFIYSTDENSTSAEPNGFNDLVLTVTTGPATGATTGTVWMYFTYYCSGQA